MSINYNHTKIASAITTILGTIYAAAGLLNSLQEFALGTIIAALGIIGYGLSTNLHDHRIRIQRQHVWARRDHENEL